MAGTDELKAIQRSMMSDGPERDVTNIAWLEDLDDQCQLEGPLATEEERALYETLLQTILQRNPLLAAAHRIRDPG